MKIKWGALVTDGRGKLGGHVASKNRGGSFLRTKVTPSNPNTTFQAAIRSILATFSALWSVLSESQRAGWNNAVGSWTSTNIFGEIKNPTGKNLFTRLNINLANTGQSAINDVPEKKEIVPLKLLSVDYDISATTLSVAYDGDQTGNKVLISATPVQTAGTYFYKGKFRNILVVAGDDSDVVDITAAYVDRFGAIPLNANIAVSVEVVAQNGQKTVASIQKVVFVA